MMMRPQDNSIIETATNWALFDPIIPLGYFAVNSDGSGAKIGNGIDVWSSLSYMGGSAIGGKSVQSDRDPVNNEMLIFCASTDKWVYRLHGCNDTETNWASNSTIFPTFTMLIELDDYTSRPTGRFKIADGVTAFPTIPWFGSEFDLTSWPTGYSVEFNGTVFEAASYVHPDELQASTLPVGAFHRDDGTWAFPSETYITGPLTATNNEVMVFDGTSGTAAKGSGVIYTDLPASTGTPNEYYQINSGVKLYDVGGELHVKDSLDAYSNVRAEALFAVTATVTTILVGGPATESTSVSVTADGTYIYVDGGKLIDVEHDGTGSGFDADYLDGFHATYFPSLDYVDATFATVAHLHDHNDLTNIQGGSIDEYYHVPSGEVVGNIVRWDGTSNYEVVGDTYHNSGVYTFPSVVDNGNGTYTVDNDGLYYLHTSSDGTGSVLEFSINGGTFTPTENLTNYLIADYNSGFPTISNITNLSLITWTTVIPIDTVYRVGNSIDFLSWDTMAKALPTKINQRLVKTERFIRETGLSISETATRIINITSGYVWYGANRLPLEEFNATDDVLREWVYDGATWIPTVVTQYNNTEYQGVSGKETISNANYYGVIWVYKKVATSSSLGNTAGYILGDQEYSKLSDAQESTIPANIPPIFSSMGMLIGRIIFEKSADAATQVDSAFVTVISSSAVTNHNDLIGLQGGTTDQYYHLSASQYASTPMYWGELASVPATYKGGDSFYDTSSTGTFKVFIASVGWIALS